jgi:hypothetical protein
MSTFRATSTATGEVVEYEAAQPQAEHRAAPWRLEQVFVGGGAPNDPQPPAAPVKITQFAFRSRFTQAEKITTELASIDVPDGQMASRQASAQMRVWLADIEAAQFIDLNYQPTRDGVQALEDYGLIAAGRAAQILDTPPTADEVWNG